MLASEGGAISWVAMHRIHHAKSDQPREDIHTPKDGFLWSHIGGCSEAGPTARWRPLGPRLVADPATALNRSTGPEHPLGLAFSWVDGESHLGQPAPVVGLNTTWFVNSATHTWGYRTFETPEGSRNLWWVGLLAWGEGWHNNHHAFQRSARHGLEWWEFDSNWLVIGP
jgi:stearoyl-CoA desaturase (delta-9 desaturase)